MSEFYDWEKTCSFDADVTMVIGARGIGKTYGIRKKAIKLFLNKGYRFVEVCRYKNELSDISDGYFDKVSNEEDFKDYYFKTDSRYGYIGTKLDKNDDKEKIVWQIICYFVSLSGSQKKKKKTFYNVKYIIFDECVLDKSERYSYYLPNEFNILAKLVDTISRERPGVDSIKPRVILLGNACDIANPYMLAYGVGAEVQFGYKWYNNKSFLLHYVKDDEYAAKKLQDTVAGRMYRIVGGDVEALNKFDVGTTDFIEKKTPNAIFYFGLVYLGMRFGIWTDYDKGYYYITDKIPKGTNRPIFSLTLQDNRVNYIAARKASKVLQDFTEMHYYGMLRYENATIKLNFERVLTSLGVK